MASRMCECGRRHVSNIKVLALEKGAVTRLPKMLEKHRNGRIFLVADETSMLLIGNRIVDMMGTNSYTITPYILRPELGTGADAVGHALVNMPRSTTLIMAVGAGRVTGIAKFLAFKTGREFCAVPSAPSCDIYSSSESLLTDKGLEEIYKARAPEYIAADIDVIFSAPKELIASGLGVALSRYISLCDWKTASIVEGSYYCHETAEMLTEKLDRLLACASGLSEYDVDAVERLTDTLLTCGAVSDYAGSGRICRGSESVIAKYIDIQRLRYGEFPKRSGQLDIACALAVREMCRRFVNEDIDYAFAESIIDEFDWTRYNREIVRLYGERAEEVLSLSGGAGRYNKEGHSRRLRIIREREDEIKGAMRDMLLRSEGVADAMKALGAPASLSEFGVDPVTVEDAIYWSKELTGDYNILSLLWDTGLLKIYSFTAGG